MLNTGGEKVKIFKNESSGMKTQLVHKESWPPDSPESRDLAKMF